MTEREALKLALEALDYAGYLTEPESDLGCNCLICQATAAVKEALAQPEQELLAWKNAALRVGEDLSSVGPKGYYNMTAQQWLDWAMAQQPRGNNSLAQPEQEQAKTLYIYRQPDGSTQVMAPTINDPSLVIDMLEEGIRAMAEGKPVTRN